jgi:N-dimethylarginine dimethylaminohydrolase
MTDHGITFQSDTTKVKRILVKHVRDAFQSADKINREWQVLNYFDPPDYSLALQEYDQFINLLEKLGVTVEFLPVADNTTLDSLYTRDNAIATNAGMLICAMGKKQRHSEPAHQKAFYESAGINVLDELQDGACIEGGDVTWLKGDILAVGHGYRTNAAGIAALKNAVKETAKEVIEVPLPHFRGPNDVLHLMSMISPVADDLAVVYSPLMPVPFRNWLLDMGYRLIEVPVSEYDNLGCNVLTIEPGVCVMVEGSPRTRKLLQRKGVEVHTFAGQEICAKGAGGPTCLTRPLERAKM